MSAKELVLSLVSLGKKKLPNRRMSKWMGLIILFKFGKGLKSQT
jgi:hypothetical protein